ncbi:MAG: hypothetical protein RR348_01020, partial [Clostridia bacterium]
MRKYREHNQYTKSRSNQIFDSLIIFGLTLLLDLILFGALGKSGAFVKNFLLGAFGFSIYGFGIAMLLISILMFFGVKRKVSARVVFVYLGILLSVIFMCHLATTKNFASLKYVDYLMYCYNSGISACGIVGAVILYPLAKLYIFSMVIFGLVIAGLVALAIVMQLNHEIVAHSFKREKKAKNRLDNVIKCDDEVGVLDVPRAPQHQQQQRVAQQKTLYNATTTGQALPNDFGKVKSSKSPIYQPIDNMNTLVEDENVLEPTRESVLIDPQEIDNDIKNKKDLSVDPLQKRKAALDELYGNNGGKPDINEYFVSPSIKGNRFSKNAEKAEKKVKKDGKSVEIDPKYRNYSSYYRKQEIERKMRGEFFVENDINGNAQYDNLSGGGNDKNNTFDGDNGIVDNKFYDDIEMALNKHLQDNKGSLNDICGTENNSQDKSIPSYNSTSQQVGKISDVDNNVEDLTTRTQNESMLDHIKKMNKQKEQEEFNKLFEKPKSVTFDGKDQNNTNSATDKYIEQAFGITKKTTVKRRMQAYIPPDVSCLRDYDEFSKDSTDIQEKVRILEEKMSDCNIDITVRNIVKGPRFFRIEFSTTT